MDSDGKVTGSWKTSLCEVSEEHEFITITKQGEIIPELVTPLFTLAGVVITVYVCSSSWTPAYSQTAGND